MSLCLCDEHKPGKLKSNVKRKMRREATSELLASCFRTTDFLKSSKVASGGEGQMSNRRTGGGQTDRWR